MIARPALRRSWRVIVTVAGIAAVLCSCSSGGGAGSTATPYAGGRFDPRGVPLLPSPAAGETDAAFQVASAALQTLVGASGGATQFVGSVTLSGASVVDLLRASAGAGIAPAEARSRLIALGWSWLVGRSAVEVRSSFAREWRVELLAFTSATGADRYAADPFLAPAALLAAGRQPPPEGAAAGAALYRAAESVAVPVGPATPAPGERAVLLWRRGRIVAVASEAQAPPGLDLAALGVVSRQADSELVRVPGSVAP
ncbi:MAG TPA: hypothetical protein VFD32_05470 [Dehalococcoidia bacterium]|nr:hypothetical protein [Dehalococcoidia bacterium]